MMKYIKLNEDKSTYEQRFIDLMAYCFKMCEPEDFKRDWNLSTPERETVLGSFDGETLASCITISYRQIYIDNKCLKMAALGGVTTASTYRSGGICSNLIKEGLKVMYEQGTVYSVLAPFSYEFYQKLGWKWCYNNISYSFNMDSLKKFKSQGHIEYIAQDTQFELNAYYEACIQKINGSCIRDDYHWDRCISRRLDHYTILYRNHEGQVEGYMIYKMTHATLTFEVVEMQYSNMVALRSFFNYISSHSAQVTTVQINAKEHDVILDVMSNPRCQATIQSYMMVRVIDVQKALEAYHFNQDGSFNIEVKDDQCEWNNGCFTLNIERGQASVRKVPVKTDLTIDIRELAQVLIGFRTLEDLEQLERVTWNQSGEQVRNYFKRQRNKVALYDYF
ncbi:MAG: GNAT family N-acetyltransferase [Niameybacter sp.]